MSRFFILEDMNVRIETFKRWYGKQHDLTIATNAEDAINILSKDLSFDVLFLDHDLGHRIFVSIKDENTGSTVAKFLEHKNIPGKIIIHSWNPQGAKNMLYYLPQAKYIPISTKEAFGI